MSKLIEINDAGQWRRTLLSLRNHIVASREGGRMKYHRYIICKNCHLVLTLLHSCNLTYGLQNSPDQCVSQTVFLFILSYAIYAKL